MSLGGPMGRQVDLTLLQKLAQINWLLIVLITMIAGVGFAMLYSAANGNIDPWASRQMIRYSAGLGLMLLIALIDIRTWLRHAYLIYGAALLLLLAVEVMGVVGMGARRWVDLGLFQLQPSEVMKIALVLALARFYHGLPMEEVGRIRWLLAPAAMILVPVALVMRQPDLGTAILLMATATAILLLAGVRLWKFAVALGAVLLAIPLAWRFMLHGYQKDRVLTYLNPERDPLGAGYHIMQSKIALGSGGVFGKGFMQGTQSHLAFLPERQTDFIFTMLAEEFGLVGCFSLLSLYILVIAYGYAIAIRSRNQFGRLLATGVISTFFLYLFINMAMVMGLIPVVGVPLPLVSYGGTSMISLLIGFGLLLSVYVHRDIVIPRRPS
ncbi:MAG: rod shape-determining protein RodA [Rhodospirillaceae bacterium]|nr:rod shape-determining protein RodA [Rhodospirillaceae bacterium]MBT4689073.1 rod shape-determining protein RodA [Rhodospirillaceae bacterium]MBT5082102.1 rod shape-determining protein RodA [Rhodospirillaceae bacterium]MBT5523575.1 rod shape-determining protein RodA [Rhodospirillaceae bacterium]MBT5879018.1 rod shape-determining protein RodA [Rhodospirillaceae bacterium]